MVCEGTWRFSGYALRASRWLMMGSGEDTTDKIERDGWCGLWSLGHGKSQHALCAGRIPRHLASIGPMIGRLWSRGISCWWSDAAALGKPAIVERTRRGKRGKEECVFETEGCFSTPSQWSIYLGISKRHQIKKLLLTAKPLANHVPLRHVRTVTNFPVTTGSRPSPHMAWKRQILKSCIYLYNQFGQP